MTDTVNTQGLVEFLQIEETGWYCWQLDCRTPGRACCSIWVDGDYEGLARLEQTGEQRFVSSAMWLEKGEHQIRVTMLWGEAELWQITPLASAPPSEGEPDFNLSNPAAAPACRRLMRVLRSLRGKGILAGQHINGSDADVELIEGLSGRLPAVVGFDMMAFSSACFPQTRTPACVNEVANCMGNIERALYWGRDRGALVTLSWHWFSPTDGWDKSFYTQNTNFDLKSALETKDHRYELLLKDIDMVAEQLKRLQDADIPVLWRPLHEADGRWFWWGACGPESYIALYRLMYDRMTHHHRLNNLIWVWNAPEDGWFPGHDVVDIIAADVYAPQANTGAIALEYSRCVQAAGGRALPAALSEAGVAPDPDKIFARNVPWLWFMLWCGFTRDEQHNPHEQLARMMKHPMVVSLEEYKALLGQE